MQVCIDHCTESGQWILHDAGVAYTTMYKVCVAHLTTNVATFNTIHKVYTAHYKCVLSTNGHVCLGHTYNSL